MTKPAKRRKATSKPQPNESARKPAKKATNLTLDSAAVARGEQFGERHGISLSQLVTDFLYTLPAEAMDGTPLDLTPPVRRLYGLVAGAVTDRDAYRAQLERKYGGR